jgi:hypothetical protein
VDGRERPSGVIAMTILEEMTKVMLAVPGASASDDEVADWYDLKAQLLDHIAAEGGPDAEEAGHQAELARRRSARLRSARHDAVVRPITSAGQRRRQRSAPHTRADAA